MQRRFPPSPVPLAASLVVLSAMLAWVAPARAGIRHCVMPGGSVVYTDSSCAALGAVEVVRPARDRPATTRVYHGRCASTLADLLFEVTSALDARDVNRLAAHYHWPGLSGRAANATMDRLEAIALRPLLDLRVDTVDVTRPPPPDDPFAAPDVDVRPAGLRLEQLREDGRAQVTTVLALRRHIGCWWLRL